MILLIEASVSIMEIGFKIFDFGSEQIGKAKTIDTSPPFGRIVRIPGQMRDTYFVDAVGPFSKDDEFRIGKILKLYEERSDITVFGNERKCVLEELVERYATALTDGTGKKLCAGKRKEYAQTAFVCSGEGLGPLSFLLGDDELEEVMVNGINSPIYVYHRRYGMLKTNLAFTSESYFVEKANQILSEIGRRIDETHPRANGVLKNGDRISIIIPPYSLSHSLDIRKFSAKPLTILNLVENGMLNFESASFLWLIMEAGGNVGIVGNTGAGKTTLLNSLFRFVPHHQRVICVEETPEIHVLQDQCVRMISVDNLHLGLYDAIMDSLRLRPDRVIIGEVRRKHEVEALRESMLSGQSLGTYFTYHAETATFALQRLNDQGIMGRDLCALDIIVACRRFNVSGIAHSKRVVTEIVEVLRELDPDSGLPKTNVLFKFDYDKNRLIKRGGGGTEKSFGRLSDEISKRYLAGKSSFAAEVKRRMKLLKSLPQDLVDDAALFEKTAF